MVEWGNYAEAYKAIHDKLDEILTKLDYPADPAVQDIIDRADRLLGRVYGSQSQQLKQRASTHELMVQLVHQGVEYQAGGGGGSGLVQCQIRNEADDAWINEPYARDISDRATRDLGKVDIAGFDAPLPSGTNNIGDVDVVSIVNPPNLDVALSTRLKIADYNLSQELGRVGLILATGGAIIDPRQIRALTSSDVITAVQGIRANLKTQPEREDLTSLGGLVSPNNAGIQIVAGTSGQKIKVYDAGYHGAVDGLHYFYFGTSTTPTTKRFCIFNTKGLIHQTFVQPRVGDAGDGLYLFSSVSETDMPYDVGYVKEV